MAESIWTKAGGDIDEVIVAKPNNYVYKEYSRLQ